MPVWAIYLQSGDIITGRHISDTRTVRWEILRITAVWPLYATFRHAIPGVRKKLKIKSKRPYYAAIVLCLMQRFATAKICRQT